MPDDLPHRIPEPEVMSDAEEAEVYRRADFREVNRRFAARFVGVLAEAGLVPADPERERRSGPASSTGRPLRLLDLGCGPADIPLRVRDLLPGSRILGLDASEAMLREGLPARSAAGAVRDVLLVRGDARRLPLADGSVDGVFSNSLLHHLPDAALPAFWAEVRRVLRPGGAVFVRDLFRPGSRAEADRLTDLHTAGEPALLRQLFHQSLLAAFRPAELRAQVAAAGLTGLRVETVTDRHVDVWGRG